MVTISKSLGTSVLFYRHACSSLPQSPPLCYPQSWSPKILVEISQHTCAVIFLLLNHITHGILQAFEFVSPGLEAASQLYLCECGQVAFALQAFILFHFIIDIWDLFFLSPLGLSLLSFHLTRIRKPTCFPSLPSIYGTSEWPCLLQWNGDEPDLDFTASGSKENVCMVHCARATLHLWEQLYQMC